MNAPIRVAVTGAAGNIGYALLFRLASGSCYGPDQPIILQLLEITPALKALEGVVMELQDSAFPLLHGVEISDDPQIAFKGVNQAFLVGARPRGPGMDRSDLIKANGPIFISQGKALAEVGASDVRALVVGNPANTNALIALHNAPGLPKDRIHAMTRLDENRAKAQLARRAGVTPGAVSHVAVWGNHSNTMFPDFRYAQVNGQPAPAVVNDEAWLKGEFLDTVAKRGAAIIAARGLSSAASAAAAAIDHMSTLWHGTPGDDWSSMAVYSDGSHYGAPADTVFSFPVRVKKRGEVEIVETLEIDDYARAKIKATGDELLAEREAIKDLLG